MRLIEAAVLAAIAKGVKTIDKLSDLLKVDRSSIEGVVAELEAQGLVRRTRRGFIFKREEFVLTSEGFNRLEDALAVLRRAAEEAIRMGLARTNEARAGIGAGENNNAVATPSSLDELILIIPILQLLGFLAAIEFPLFWDNYISGNLEWGQDS